MKTARWVRKWSRDAAADDWSPLPLEVVSNEEYAPLPPTAEQRHVAAIHRETSTRHARRLGMSRRAFLSSTTGMAALLNSFTNKGS